MGGRPLAELAGLVHAHCARLLPLQNVSPPGTASAWLCVRVRLKLCNTLILHSFDCVCGCALSLTE